MSQSSRLRSFFNSNTEVVSGVIFLGALILYTSTLIQVHTYDAISYAYSAGTGFQDLERLLYPHHLGYQLATYYYYSIWSWLGWEGGSLLPLQLITVLTSALTLVLFNRILRNFTNLSIALLFTALLAVANGFWLFSVEIEVYLPSLLLVLLTFYFLTKWSLQQGIHCFAIGCLWGSAILFHQMNVLFGAVILAAILTQRRAGRSILISLLKVTAGAFPIVVIPYLLAIRALQLVSLRSVLYWLTWLTHIGLWGSPTPDLLLRTAQGTGHAFIGTANQGFPTLLFVQFLATIILILFAAWKAFKSFPGIAIQCLVWILVYGGFIIWWEAENPEFWVGLLPPFFMLLAMTVQNSKLPIWAVQGGLIALIFAVGINNWKSTISPLQEAETNPDFQRLMKLVADCMPRGSFVIANSSRFWPWLVYYRDMNVVSIDRVLLTAERDFPEQTTEFGMREVINRIERAFSEGHNVYWLVNAYQSTPILARNRLDQDRILEHFSAYDLRPLACSFPLFQLEKRKVVE